jgi:cell division protein FtsI (penicillin-binding protein 3)
MIRSSRIGFIHLSLVLFGLGLLAKSAQLQIVEGKEWAERAARQQRSAQAMPAGRGEIRDISGAVLAQSREMLQISIAPRDLRDRGRARLLLATADVPPEWIDRATDTTRRWVTLPGRHYALDVAELLSLRGVHPTPTSERVYAMSQGLRSIVGRVGRDGEPLDGLELALDSLLRGTGGSAQVVRDGRGRELESPASQRTEPTPGHTIVLTINHELQEIAERALDQAVDRMNADGGDIVLVDPHTGAVRAMASRRRDRSASSATALTEPFEPGSTLKPFIAAGLLARDRVRPSDRVPALGGVLEIQGRTIRDVHRADSPMTLEEVVRWSSNVGIVQFAERLSPGEKFETLRDFGFGTPTGTPFPSEAGGTLRVPARWSKQSPASISMGYEIAVTPLQLAMAYAVFANGGELLEPALVAEISAADGNVRYRHERRVVRRVLLPAVADRMRAMLLDVVTNGTAVQADVDAFLVAGKTGTARRTLGGRYAAMQYFATFVGLFPAENPQLVILVKLDSPQGAYYGGATAAPITKTVLEAAVAARDAALDRSVLASQRRAHADTLLSLAQAGRTRRSGAALDDEDRSPRSRLSQKDWDTAALAAMSAREAPRLSYVVSLPAADTADVILLPPRPVPAVDGLSLRDAVRALHGAGFRVSLAQGISGGTDPAPGTLLGAGATVRLHYDY